MVDDDARKSADPSQGEDNLPRRYAPGVKLLQRRTFQLDLQTRLSPTDIKRWMLGAASKTVSASVLTEEFACRLAQAGLGVSRLSLNVGILHPQLFGYAWNWSSLDGICDEIQIPEETLYSDAYRKNPLFRVMEHGEVLRLMLTTEKAKAQSPLMGELAAANYTEYVAFPLFSSGERYNAVTLATQQAGGFSDSQYETLQELLEIFALHVERHIASRIAENISHTYLGREAGSQVVSGTIRRGSGLPIRAIIWSSDMRGFSSLSEEMDSRAVAEVLNDYFSVLADAVMRQGGDVLKFVGDGMLAVFPLADFATPNLAAKASATAAREAVEGLRSLNRERSTSADWRALKTGIGLHVGEVFFGNVGAARRLDFTVIGEAVNIASRVEGLCKQLDREILLSEPVAALLDETAEAMGAQRLKGMQKAEQVFALSDDS